MYESEFQLPSESYEFPGESEGEFGYEAEGETLEAQLAGELLEVSTEAELDQFLGKLASSVLKGASTFIKSPVGKALGGVLKNVAKTALPAIGGALGSVVPVVGTALGTKLGSLAGGLIKEEEAEMMSEAEAEYEAAQRYVRFARAAVGNAARVPRNVPHQAAVRAASISAARRYAPSLLRSDQSSMSPWRQRRRRSYRPQPSWSYAEPMPYWDDPGNGYGAEPQPWSTDGVDFTGEAEAPAAGPAGPRAAEGRWVRRGGRIVVIGV